MFMASACYIMSHSEKQNYESHIQEQEQEEKGLRERNKNARICTKNFPIIAINMLKTLKKKSLKWINMEISTGNE